MRAMESDGMKCHRALKDAHGAVSEAIRHLDIATSYMFEFPEAQRAVADVVRSLSDARQPLAAYVAVAEGGAV